MCGIAAIFGDHESSPLVRTAIGLLAHRGPDADGVFTSECGTATLGHRRLSIIDPSSDGDQPMVASSGQYTISFNGEIYNYRELRRQLSSHTFRTATDTEVLLASFAEWGPACLDRLIGMFAFVIWDQVARTAFVARDRFGVKPLYFHHSDGGALRIASEIRAVHALGVKREPDAVAWTTYLATGLQDHSSRTFWNDVSALPPGHWLQWRDGKITLNRWYDLADASGTDFDERPFDVVAEEYRSLLHESVQLRLRSDVAVALSLSGGLDSSLLLALVDEAGHENCHTFTFATGDDRFDELPWVQAMVDHTGHSSTVATLHSTDVANATRDVSWFSDGPFGGIPTLAYAGVMRVAQQSGIKVMLDGQGMDEQWAGYDYYTSTEAPAPIVQGSAGRTSRPECLSDHALTLVEPFDAPRPFPDDLRNLQYRDLRYTKLPRALRFNDRISMMSSIELREPFLDHRLVELAFRQPADRKISGKTTKVGLRTLAGTLMPAKVNAVLKRPVQTPQTDWLRGPLRDWCHMEVECFAKSAWAEEARVVTAWNDFVNVGASNSAFVWQWISASIALRDAPAEPFRTSDAHHEDHAWRRA